MGHHSQASFRPFCRREGLPVADGQKTTLRWGRNWYGGRRLGRLGARIGNVRQGDDSMNSTNDKQSTRSAAIAALLAIIAGAGIGYALMLATGSNVVGIGVA